jgi:6-pyruvoyltetrahydropterin/6-carboxytetrahydropterin synthase
MYYLARYVAFEASHRYWNRTFSEEYNRQRFGKCVSPYGHGHNYVLRVTLRGHPDPRTGMIVNLKELDRLLKELTDEFDHKFINREHPAFRYCIPTTENLTSYLYDRLDHTLRTIRTDYQLHRVTLYEEPTLWADAFITAGNKQVELTKAVNFTAVRRLRSIELSDEENRAIFGKEANLHGHDYQLAVTVQGCIEPRTGMIIDLTSLLQTVYTEVLDRFDHVYLNEDTTAFKSVNPTGENMVKVIWDLLRPRLGACLTKVTLWEPPNTRFVYHGR